jgi:hypothetical protein
LHTLFILHFFFLIFSITSTLSSSPDDLSSIWFNLLERLSTEFLIYLRNIFISRFSIWFFSGFLYLYWIPFSRFELSSLFHLAFHLYPLWVNLPVYLHSLWIHLDVYLYSLLFHWEIYMSSFILLICQIIYCVITDFLRCHIVLFSCYLCLFIEIYSSEVKSLVRGFNHIKSFRWIILDVLAGLGRVRVDVSFLQLLEGTTQQEQIHQFHTKPDSYMKLKK